MQLKVAERIVLLSILPKEGDFTTLKIIRKLREDLSFSEEEHKELQFKTTESSTIWDVKADVGRDIQIGEKATDVVSALKGLNTAGKLTFDHFSLYEKFIGE